MRELWKMRARQITLIATVVAISATLVPVPASAASSMITSRKLTLANSAPGYQAAAATGDYTFTFTTVNTQTVGSTMFEICDDPIAASCANAAGSTGVDASAVTYVSGSSSGNLASGASLNAGPTTNTFILNKTVASTTAGVNVLVFRNIKNPTGTNKTFFVKISTYAATAGGGALGDYGSVAAAVVQQMVVQADVKETLTFCVFATGASCAAPGSTLVDLDVSTTNAFSTSATSYGKHSMEASTNANSGYVIQYLATQFAGPAQNIGVANGSSSNLQTPTTGSEQFGLTLSTSTLASGVAPTGGSGNCTTYTNYCTANQYSWSPSATVTVPIASSASVSSTTTYNASFITNISTATKPGRYTTTMMYICTPTY